MPRAPVNGLRLYYESSGDGPPLVLVHGFACGIRSWDPQVRELASRYRVVTYDVVGHLTNLEAPAVFNAAVSRFLAMPYPGAP